MSEREDDIFCGSGKSTNERFTNISVCLTDIPKEHIFEYNGKKYVKLTVVKKNEVDKYGKTHFLKVDTWKPDNDDSEQETQEEVTDDLPF